MIREAVLYLATPDDVDAAALPVAARPVAFRVVMAAVRAGLEHVAVPDVLRRPVLEAAIAATPSARRRVVWIAGGAPPPRAPVILLPAATLVTAATVRPLVTAEPLTALVGTEDAEPPLVSVPESLAATLWTSLATGEPIGDALRRMIKGSRAVRATPGLFERVRGAEGAERATRRLLAALGSAVDTRLDTVVHRRLSRPVTRAAVALGISPNVITLVSLFMGLAAVAGVLVGSLGGAVAGLLLYAAAVVLDHADGEVARLTFAESALGEWLDVGADTIVHGSLVVALGVVAERLAGAGASTGILAAAGVLAAAWLTKTSPPARGPLGGVLSAVGNRDGFYAMLVAFIAVRALRPQALPLLMVLVAAGTNAYWLGHLAARLRAR